MTRLRWNVELDDRASIRYELVTEVGADIDAIVLPAAQAMLAALPEEFRERVVGVSVNVTEPDDLIHIKVDRIG